MSTNYMNHKILCPSCNGEGGEVNLAHEFIQCYNCNGEGYVVDENAEPMVHYKETDEFDASKEQDIRDSLREEGL